MARDTVRQTHRPEEDRGIDELMRDAKPCKRCGARIWPKASMKEHREYHRKRDGLSGADHGRKCVGCGTFFRGYYPKCPRCRSPEAKAKKRRRSGPAPGSKQTKRMGSVKVFTQSLNSTRHGRR